MALINNRSIRLTGTQTLQRVQTVGNQQKFTFATWFKRTAISQSVAPTIIGCGDNGGSNFFAIYFDPTDEISVRGDRGAANNTLLKTVTKYTDTAKWHHVCVAVDTTQAVLADRVKLYVDGTQITSFTGGAYSVPTPLNQLMMASGTWYYGRLDYSANGYYPGLFDECYYIDGAQLTPADFIDGLPGQPKAFVGSFGTQGYLLRFEDPTNSTTLGADSSGLAHNWTINSATSSTDAPNLVPAFTNAKSLGGFAGSQSISRAHTGLVNRTTFTMACWVKRTTISTVQTFLGLGTSAGPANDAAVSFQPGNTIIFQAWNASQVSIGALASSTTLTDTTGWHHICVAIDSTQAAAIDRQHIWIDGVEVAYASNTAPAQNTVYMTGTTFYWGRLGYSATNFYRGLLDEAVFIEGLALDPSYFLTGTPGGAIGPADLSAIALAGQSSWLRFEDPTSTTTLGFDSSGLGNNWTLASFTTANSSTDAPAVLAITTLQPALVTDVDTVNAPAVVAGATTLHPALVADADAFNAPAVVAAAATLLPDVVVGDDDLKPVTVVSRYPLLAGTFTDSDSPQVAAIASSYSLTAGLLSDADSFQRPNIQRGEIGLQPDAEHLDAANLVTPDVALGPAPTGVQVDVVHADSDTVFAAILARHVLPARIIDADLVLAASLGAGGIVLQPSLVQDELTDAVFACTIYAAIDFGMDEFIDRWENAEYNLLRHRMWAGVQFIGPGMNKKWDLAMVRNSLNTADPFLVLFKEALVEQDILTPDRADEIFAGLVPVRVGGRKRRLQTVQPFPYRAGRADDVTQASGYTNLRTG